MVNGITLYRVVAAPVLILLIVLKQVDIFKWMLVLSFFTDAIDGYLARKYKVFSKLGSKLDSVGDDLTVGAAIAGVIFFKGELLKHEAVLAVMLAALYIIQTTLALLRYHKISSFHTYIAKVAAVLQGIFFILLFFVPGPVYILFRIMAIVTIADLLEEITLVIILRTWQTNVKGLYWVLKNKKKG